MFFKEEALIRILALGPVDTNVCVAKFCERSDVSGNDILYAVENLILSFLVVVVGRGMKSTRGTAGRIFSALAHANINVKMIDQGSSELNIIIGVDNSDFEAAIKAIYDIFVNARL